MTQWTWTYESDEDDVSTTITMTHDEEYRDQIQERFHDFLRGCGYVVDPPEGDIGEEALVEDLQDRIQIALEYVDTMWVHNQMDRASYREDLANLTSILNGA